MSTERQLTEDVATDIETWERRVHPLVRQWEHLALAKSLRTCPPPDDSRLFGPGAAWINLATAYANLGRAWATMPYLWVDPAVTLPFGKRSVRWPEGHHHVWPATFEPHPEARIN
jgi:hypothetical protein